MLHCYTRFLFFLIIAFALFGCESIQTPKFDYSSVAATDEDHVLAEVMPLSQLRVAVLIPVYEQEFYMLAGESLLGNVENALDRIAFLDCDTLLDFTEAPSTNKNTWFLDHAILVELARTSHFDALVLLDIKSVNMQATRTNTEILNKTEESYSYNLHLSASVTMINLMQDTTRSSRKLRKEIIHEANERDPHQSVTVAASSMASYISTLAEMFFTPCAQVVEVRGDGKYIKVNVGAAHGVAIGNFLKIVVLHPIKNQEGKIISSERRPLTFVSVIETSEHFSWCDASMARKRVRIGNIVELGN